VEASEKKEFYTLFSRFSKYNEVEKQIKV